MVRFAAQKRTLRDHSDCRFFLRLYLLLYQVEYGCRTVRCPNGQRTVLPQFISTIGINAEGSQLLCQLLSSKLCFIRPDFLLLYL
jgi:hypothetical protein